MGKENILKLLESHSPIWDRIKVAPQKIETFLDMFMRYDEIVAQEENEDGEEEGEGNEEKDGKEQVN
jgi:hypothetical protein